METYAAKKKRLADAKLLAAKSNHGPIVRLGKESQFKKFVEEQKAKMKPKKEKKIKVVKKGPPVSALTQRIGELSDSGLSLDEIAAQVGLGKVRTRARLDTWLRVMD